MAFVGVAVARGVGVGDLFPAVSLVWLRAFAACAATAASCRVFSLDSASESLRSIRSNCSEK